MYFPSYKLSTKAFISFYFQSIPENGRHLPLCDGHKQYIKRSLLTKDVQRYTKLFIIIKSKVHSDFAFYMSIIMLDIA